MERAKDETGEIGAGVPLTEPLTGYALWLHELKTLCAPRGLLWLLGDDPEQNMREAYDDDQTPRASLEELISEAHDR